MNVEKNEIPQNKDKMCKSCKLFYASQSFQGFCSSCYKKNQNPKKQQTQIKQNQIKTSTTLSNLQQQKKKEQQIPAQPIQKDRKRCFHCNKKVGLLGIQCKCTFVFCNKHRLPEDHNCNFNHKQEGKKKLQKQIVKVYNGKIGQI